MNDSDMLLWITRVAVTPLTLLPATVAGGWFIRYSSVVEDWRARWQGAKGGAEALFVEQWGNDPTEVPDWGTRVRSWRQLIRLKFYGALVCGTCFGWHVGWVLLAVQAAVAWRTGGPALVGWAEALPVIGGLWGWHTVTFKRFEEMGWFTK